MTKYFKLLVWPIGAIPCIYLATIWNSLPDRVAMHFDSSGQPDRYGSKTELLIMIIILSVMSIVMYFVLANIYKIDPKKYAAENKDRLRRMGFIISVFMSALSCFIIYITKQENVAIGMNYIFAGIALLFSFLGNYMHNMKPNYFAGIRVPWTLNNEENWRRTHLLAGKLWFAGGFIIALLCLLLPDKIALIAFFISTAALVLIPVVYSYMLYKAGNHVNNTNQK